LIARAKAALLGTMEEAPNEPRSLMTKIIYGALGAIILAPLVIGVAWTQRRPIAREFIDDELTQRGVQASYELTLVGTKLQRIEHIVIGDPRNPDLTADWAEIDTNAKLSGVSIKAVRASGVRVHGALVGNTLKLGMLDKLLPPKSDEPFSLPDMDIKLIDARARLDTEYGQFGARLDGGGNPAGVFKGKLAVVAPRFERADCNAEGLTAFVDLETRDKKIEVKGPVRAAQMGCGANRANGVVLALDGSMTERLDAWDGNAELRASALHIPGAQLANAILASDFVGDAEATTGKFNFDFARAAFSGGSAGDTGVGGNFRIIHKRPKEQSIYVDGTILAKELRPDQSVLIRAARFGSAAAGTPAAPIVASLTRAVERLREGSTLRSRFDLSQEGDDGELRFNHVEATSRSGAQISFAGRDPLRYLWPDGGLVIASIAKLTGGGFPTADVQLAGRDGRWSGTARIAPMVSGDTRIALAPVNFSLGAGGAQIATVAVVDGRIGTTRFTGVQFPVSMSPGASLLSGCRPISFEKLELPGISLAPTRFETCFNGQQATFNAPRIAGAYQNAPFALSGARARYDLGNKQASIDAPRFEGRYRTTSFTLAGTSARYSERSSVIELPRIEGRYGKTTFALKGNAAHFETGAQAAWIDTLSGSGKIGTSPFVMTMAGVHYGGRNGTLAVGPTGVKLGHPDSQTTLDFDKIEGTVRGPGGNGIFAGARGKIGNIPLDMSNGNGRWRYAANALVLNGSVGVADREAVPRFQPLISNDFTLRYARDTITAQGNLTEPKNGTTVSGVDLVHNLSNGTGRAVLSVAGLKFSPKLQPEEITRTTLGVIANVEGSVAGRGEIRWTPRGVTSDGRFSTEGLNLAAAFGPVRELKGEIVFTDLLGLTTAPGQTLHIAEINPGVQVANGIVRYRLLPGLKAEIEGGHWPFSGGELILEPTVLDLSDRAERHLTFRVSGLDAEKFVNALQFSNISATGIFDGVMPMIFDKTGGRIEAGNLIARDSGGTLSYIGEVSKENLGTFGTIAFDALRSMRFKKLAIDLGGPLDGEMVTQIRFAGVNQLPIVPGRAKFPLPIKVQGLNGIPFIFNITIKAPFRGLLKMATDIQDPTRLIQEQMEEDRRRQEELKAPKPSENPDKPVQQ
jgi:translocation and assembly module TamB